MVKIRCGAFETNSSSSHSLSCYREYKTGQYSIDEVVEKYRKSGKLVGNKLNINFYDYCMDDRVVDYKTVEEKLDAIHTYAIQKFMNKLDYIHEGDKEFKAMDDEDKQTISEERFWRQEEKTINFINRVKRKDYDFLFDEDILRYFRNILIYIEDTCGSIEFKLNDDNAVLGIFEYDDENFFVKASIDDIYTVIVDDSVFIQIENTRY